jgi:N-methylhydantoinase B
VDGRRLRLAVDVLCRRHGAIVAWGTGELLPETTRESRATLGRRAVPHWP